MRKAHKIEIILIVVSTAKNNVRLQMDLEFIEDIRITGLFSNNYVTYKTDYIFDHLWKSIKATYC